jgi:deazaflavin-dependent oxidoreductase (nitroreductase family)
LRPFVARLEVAQIRRSGRSALGALFHTDVLVLTTIGRRTGRWRETPVAYLECAGGWLISGGAGGQQRVDWVANLRAHPDAWITVRRRRIAVVAEALDGDDYDQAHVAALHTWPRIARYEKRSGRAVPMFLLRPRG